MKKTIPLVLASGIMMTASGTAFAATGSDVINAGSKYLGIPYSYGAPVGSTTAFDCSSFTVTIFKKYGINLPRVAADQANVGVQVDKSQLQVGDLLFFDTNHDGVINHVGVYSGNGQMLDAENTYGVHFTNPFSSYWGPRFVKAMRVLNVNNGTASSGASNITDTSNSNAASNSYTVISGDSLWGIASQNNLSVAVLKSLNHLSSDVIHPGEVLQLSANSSVPSSAPKVTPVSLTVSQPVQSSPATASSYNVKSGDSLWGIANNYNLSVAQLKNLNHLKSDVIYPGQVLTVSSNAPSSSTAAVQPVTETSPSSSSYKVASGDSLWEIATLHDITVNKLMKTNNLSSTIIYPGQNLVIPN